MGERLSPCRRTPASRPPRCRWRGRHSHRSRHVAYVAPESVDSGLYARFPREQQGHGGLVHPRLTADTNRPSTPRFRQLLLDLAERRPARRCAQALQATPGGLFLEAALLAALFLALSLTGCPNLCWQRSPWKVKIRGSALPQRLKSPNRGRPAGGLRHAVSFRPQGSDILRAFKVVLIRAVKWQSPAIDFRRRSVTMGQIRARGYS